MTQAGSKNVLIIEDDQTLNKLLVKQLANMGFDAQGVRSHASALAALAQSEPSLIILDIRLPDADGMALVGELREVCPVIILTAYGSIVQAVEAVKAGASEYLVKPVSANSLDLAVNRALENASLRRNVQFWQKQARRRSSPKMVGDSPAFAELLATIDMIAPTDTTVLIEGESGVGKELVAQSIHERSPRCGSPIVAVDCCTLQENLFESELFGHERGAFTGADRKKAGLIEVAENGTVFLDEIGEVAPAIQAKLLRVIETGKFRRLGGTRDLGANVRFVAATNRNLSDMCDAGRFRTDLYYRLNAFNICVPPLRLRKDDIAPITMRILESRTFMRSTPKTVTPSAIKALKAYHWPGNIRELRNVVERSILLSGDQQRITARHIALPKRLKSGSAGLELSFDHEPTLDEIRKTYLRYLMQMHNGNRQRISAILGISERNTYRLIKKLGEATDTGANVGS